MTPVAGEWPMVRLGDVLVAKYGKALTQANRQGGNVPVYGSNGAVGAHDKALTAGPTIIIGRKGSSGAVNFSDVPCWPIDTAYYIDDPGPFLFQFLVPLLRSLGLEELDRSTAIPGLNRDQLYDLEVPVPSLETQRNLIPTISGSVDLGKSATAHLHAAKQRLQRFRQAVLMAASTGRLTSSWRDDRVGVSGVAADVSTLEVADTGLDLPEGWVATRVGEVGDVQLGGTPSRKTEAYWNGEVRWVSSGEVANCRIGGTRETISQLGLQSSSAKIYPVGTVLIAMIGEGKTRGQAAILDVEAATNQNAAGILPNRTVIDPEYLWRWALGQYEITRAVGRGGNQPALNKQKVRELVIALPPLGEQVEIVRRVDLLLDAADQLGRRIDVALANVSLGSRLVSSKVFRGDVADS